MKVMNRVRTLARQARIVALAVLAGVAFQGFEGASAQNCSLPGILALIRGDFPDKSALVEMYNRYLTSDGSTNPACDIGVSVSGRSALDYVNQLRGIEPPGGKLTSYFSVTAIESNIETDRRNGVEWIFYDLEGGLSPTDEVKAPIYFINQAADIVHREGLKFAFTVVNIIDDQGKFIHPRQIITHVVGKAEAYNPQGQRFIQQGCGVYAQEVGDIMILAKKHNPSLRLWAQLSLLRGTVEANQDCLSWLINYLAQRGYRLDSVTVFYGLRDEDTGDTAGVIKELDQFYQWYNERYRSSLWRIWLPLMLREH